MQLDVYYYKCGASSNRARTLTMEAELALWEAKRAEMPEKAWLLRSLRRGDSAPAGVTRAPSCASNTREPAQGATTTKTTAADKAGIEEEAQGDSQRHPGEAPRKMADSECNNVLVVSTTNQHQQEEEEEQEHDNPLHGHLTAKPDGTRDAFLKAFTKKLENISRGIEDGTPAVLKRKGCTTLGPANSNDDDDDDDDADVPLMLKTSTNFGLSLGQLHGNGNRNRKMS